MLLYNTAAINNSLLYYTAESHHDSPEFYSLVSLIMSLYYKYTYKEKARLTVAFYSGKS